MEKNKQELHTSIPVIIIALIIFFPIGILLCYLRIVDKKGNYKTSAKISFWTGFGFVSFAILGIICCIGEDDYLSLFACCLFIFLLPGAVLIHSGNKKRKKMKNYEKYIQCIGARRKVAIDYFVEKIGCDQDTAINNITDMINHHIINGYINENNELILDGYVEKKAKEMQLVKCKECGAKNSVEVGSTCECEYCGTILQAKV